MTDFITYVFKFSDAGAAARDSVLSAGFITTGGGINPNPPPFIVQEILVYQDLTANSVVPNSGYWCIVVNVGPNATFAAHPNLQLVMDQSTQTALFSLIPTAHIGIVLDNVGTYVTEGLH